MKTTLIICTLCLTASLSAQFLTPNYRGSSTDDDFAYWLGFDVAYTDAEPPFTGMDETEVNHPFLGGNNSARLGQYSAPGAIITSAAGIYSFGDATAYQVYDNPSYSPGDILFQTMTLSGSQSTPDFGSVKLFYRTTENGAWIEADLSVAASVESSDSDGNLFTAWEWDTSSLLIVDYYIQFSYPLNHSSFIQAQLDSNENFALQLDGFGVNIDTNIPFGLLFGAINRSPEKLIYNDGESVTITAVPNSNFVFVKWVGPLGESTQNPLQLTVTGETEILLVLAPKQYNVWRQLAFASAHGGGITSQDWAADNDYDGDNRLNALEYALGDNPESGVIAKAPEQTVVNVAGIPYPALVFPQQFAATDLTYTVGLSTDLSIWRTNANPGGPYTAAPEILSLNDDGTQQVRVRSLTPLDAANPQLLQLNISLN